MKRILALALVLSLTLGISAAALASTDYESDLLKALNMSSSELITTSNNRCLICAVTLLTYLVVNPNGSDALDKISGSGNARICARSARMDIYYPTTDGQYLNLYVNPTLGKLSDYGYTSTLTATDQYTYYSVSMDDILSLMLEILQSAE